MREILLAVVMLSAGLAGCIGGDDAPAEPASTTNTTDLNPWQRGLEEDYPTPDVAEHRNASERRADVAEPGDPEFAAFDAEMEAWMAEHEVPAGQLAIMKDGELRYTNAYGYTDKDETEPATTETMFRIASVTKPMTAAVVAMQVEQGMYNWTDPVFCVPPAPDPACLLPIEPHGANPVEDDRLEDIKVQHLIGHTAGWAGETDWMLFSPGPIEVAEEMGIQTPPSAWRTVQYLMGESLARDPGAQYEYSNLGYTVAGLVAEAATGAQLEALYDAYLFGPLEVEGDIEAGESLPEDRNPREPFYACDLDSGTRTTPNVYNPDETVCWPDGGQAMGTTIANGGLVSTAAAVAAVYEAYGDQAHGPFPSDESPYAWHFMGGGAPGTAAFAADLAEGASLSGNLQFVFVFNSREGGPHCLGAQLPHCTSDPGLVLTMETMVTSWGAADNVAR